MRQGAGSIPSYLEGVQIVNHSAFPVQLVEVGVIDNDGKELKFLSTESPVIGEVVLIKERSSQKITPTTHAAILSALSNLKSCYAKTGEGKIFTGKIRNLKRVELRKPFDR